MFSRAKRFDYSPNTEVQRSKIGPRKQCERFTRCHSVRSTCKKRSSSATPSSSSTTRKPRNVYSSKGTYTPSSRIQNKNDSVASTSSKNIQLVDYKPMQQEPQEEAKTVKDLIQESDKEQDLDTKEQSLSFISQEKTFADASTDTYETIVNSTEIEGEEDDDGNISVSTAQSAMLEDLCKNVEDITQKHIYEILAIVKSFDEENQKDAVVGGVSAKDLLNLYEKIEEKSSRSNKKSWKKFGLGSLMRKMKKLSC